jgi:uncharacterized membrane protein
MLAYALGAGALGACVVFLGPPGTDLAAHLYQRSLFLRDGFSFWNNFWYSGRYSYVTYSLLYYPLAAIVGLKALAIVTVAVAAGAFALVVEREWGPCARSASLLFAVAMGVSLVLAAYPYTLGLSVALLSAAAVQAHRFKVFALLALATIAASPLAFGLLALVLVAAFIETRRFFLRAGVPLLFVGAAGAMLWRLFPGNGSFPFALSELGAILLFCGLGIALTRGVSRARLLFLFFVCYGLASIVCYLVSSDVGANIARVRFVAVPIAALTLSLRGWRPRAPAVVAIGLALAWNVTPLVASVDRAGEDPSANAAYWQPAIRYLQRHLGPSFRVEAVDTSGHWEATYLPDAGIPIARGWFRQDDFPKDAVLYRRELTRTAYLAWLHRIAARYVVLTTAPPDYSSRSEERLLASGRSGLPVVLRAAHMTIFAVPSPRPIVTGPDRPRVRVFHNSTLVLDLRRPGTYRLAVTYTPYWSAAQGCIHETADGTVMLTTTRRGLVRLSARFGLSEAIDALAGVTDTCSSSTSKVGPPTTSPRDAAGA